MNPLGHYARFGHKEGRLPCAAFDSNWYRAEYLKTQPDVDPLSFHIEFGAAAGLSVNSAEDSSRSRQTPIRTRSLEFVERAARDGAEVKLPDQAIPRGKTVRVRGQRRSFDNSVLAILGKLGGSAYVNNIDASECLPTIRLAGRRPKSVGAPTIVVCSHIVGKQKYGAERSFIDIIEGISPLAVNVVVIAPQNDSGYTAALLPYANEVIVFHYEWWKRAASPSASEIATFVEIFRSVQASAVHVNTIVIRGPMIAARLEGVPVVCHAREIIPHDEPLLRMIGLPAEIVQETISETADWIVANSKATASAFTKAGRTVVIPNTVDPALFDIPNRICSNAIKFGMISSNLPKKGIEDFVALAKEARGVKNAKFLIIGENTKLIERLKEEQSRNQIPSNIEFVGYQENPVNAISMVNVVVNFSSFAESFGRTVLEGLAARRPAIVYEWGALPELVHDGLNGYVVPYRRYLSAVNRVQELCRDPELIGRLGENGRAMAIRSFGKKWTTRARFVDYTETS